MSKIYRRPMFRGGGTVSSYGNGIASGLGYAKGGTIGGGYIQGQRMPDGRYGFKDPFPIGSTRSAIDAGRSAIDQMYNVPSDAEVAARGTAQGNQGGNILKRNLNKVKNFKLASGKNLESKLVNTASKGIKGLYNLIPQGNQYTRFGNFAGKNFPKLLKGSGILSAISGPKMVAEISEPQTYAALQYQKENSKNNAGVFDETAFDDFTQYDEEFQRLNDTTKFEAIVDQRGFFNKYINPFSISPNTGKTDGEEATIVATEKEEKEKAADAAAAATGKDTTVNINTGEPIVESRKDRLKRTAKEYQEILGDGIKKDSIFDAMVTGGTSLMEGQGFAQAAREVNKSLDPIQNIKTAANKAALEEDIAVRRALAVSKGKRTATGELLDFYKSVKGADGKRAFTDLDISEKLDKGTSKNETLIKLKDGLGTGPGFKQYVRGEYGSDIKFFDVDVEKVDFENIEDGVYYQPPTGKADKYKDKFLTVKDNKVVKITPRNR